MLRLPNAPPEDIFQIDLGPLKSFLVDLPFGAMKGMRREQEGWTWAAQEIVRNQATYAARAGITARDFDKFVALNGQYDQILAHLPQVQKAHEVLTESLAHVDNLRHRFVTMFADAAEAHTNAEGGDPTLLTAYQRTIAYRGVIASKGIRTRRRNGEAKKAQDGATGANEGTQTAEPVETETAVPAEATETAETTETGEPGEKEAHVKAARGMSRAPSPPPEDIFKIDLAALKPFLVDLPPGAMIGMRHVQEGWESVVHEITQNQSKYGERAGIAEGDFKKFTALNKQYAQIRAQIPLMAKALEILTESLAHVDNLRHRFAAMFADAAEAHANAEGGDPTLLTAYEKTIAYRGIIGDKAFKTRRRNEEAQEASGGVVADDKP